MPDFSRDIDIGNSPAETYNVEVQNFESVIASINSAAAILAEAAAELRKITLGTGLSIGVDLDEEVE